MKRYLLQSDLLSLASQRHALLGPVQTPSLRHKACSFREGRFPYLQVLYPLRQHGNLWSHLGFRGVEVNVNEVDFGCYHKNPRDSGDSGSPYKGSLRGRAGKRPRRRS